MRKKNALIASMPMLVFMVLCRIAKGDTAGTGKPLSVFCAGAEFRVPPAYLTGQVPQPGVSSGFSMTWLLALPGLDPPSPNTAAPIYPSSAINYLRAVFTCADNSGMTPAVTRVKEILANSGLREDQYTTLDGGLRLYLDRQPGIMAELYVQPATDRSPLIFMQCPSDGFVPYPMCTVIERLDEHAKVGFNVLYAFNKRYRLRLLEIDKLLRARLASMNSN